MKLIDLHEKSIVKHPEDDEFNDGIDKDTIRTIFINGDTKILGNGSYAVVYDVPHETNTVVKTSNKSLTKEEIENDPYFHYIDAISGEVEKTQNPYLPRIHEVKFKKNSSGSYIYAVKIEKLHDSRNFLKLFGYREAIDHIVNLSEKLFKKSLFDKSDIEDYKDDPRISVSVMLDILGDELSESLASLNKIADPQLKSALKTINKVIRKNDSFHSDLLKAENIMYRITPYGLQPVFTDPVFTLINGQ